MSDQLKKLFDNAAHFNVQRALDREASLRTPEDVSNYLQKIKGGISSGNSSTPEIVGVWVSTYNDNPQMKELFSYYGYSPKFYNDYMKIVGNSVDTKEIESLIKQHPEYKNYFRVQGKKVTLIPQRNVSDDEASYLLSSALYARSMSDIAATYNSFSPEEKALFNKKPFNQQVVILGMGAGKHFETPSTILGHKKKKGTAWDNVEYKEALNKVLKASPEETNRLLQDGDLLYSLGTSRVNTPYAAYKKNREAFTVGLTGKYLKEENIETLLNNSPQQSTYKNNQALAQGQIPSGRPIPNTSKIPTTGSIPTTNSIPTTGRISNTGKVPTGNSVPRTRNVPSTEHEDSSFFIPLYNTVRDTATNFVDNFKQLFSDDEE